MNNDHSPFSLFAEWFEEAQQLDVNTPSAMVLSTADQSGRPSARIVLLKEWDKKGFVFYTNFYSKKAKELDANPQASLLFYWDALGKQVRIEGTVERTDRESSQQYFESRPRESQLGAWASHQSTPLESRSLLEDQYSHFQQKYPDQIPLPEFWGGYLLFPDYFEFWENGIYRLHHRQTFKRQAENWETTLLFP
jgi:pyridoxamine 5'-phosphate oxidase